MSSSQAGHSESGALRRATVSIQDLPVEVRPATRHCPLASRLCYLPTYRKQLIYDIHHLSLSSTLSQVSQHLHSLLSASSPRHKATFLLLRHPKRPLAHGIRYPICTLPVVYALERLALAREKKLKCPELPKRLARGVSSPSTATELDLELLEHMLVKYNASPNSHKGYLLARAVLAQHEPLIRLLVAHGADPALKDGWAVNAAIGQGDLALVKLLLEREVVRGDGIDEDGDECVGKSKKRRRTSADGGGGKRRRMENRCEPTSAMLEMAVRAGQWAIVDYLTARGPLLSLL